MFQVVEKQTGKVHTVYAVLGLFFLIYDDGWRWVEMKDFDPVLPEVAERCSREEERAECGKHNQKW